MQVSVDYDKAIERKDPEQVAFIIVKDGEKGYNPMPLSWTMITSFKPPMMAIALGKKRHTAALLDVSQEFVLAFPSEGMEEDVWAFGSSSGKAGDKLKKSKVATEKAQKIDSLLLTDAVANFECVVTSRQITGDHILYTGEVVCSHMNTNPNLKRIYTVGEALKPL